MSKLFDALTRSLLERRAARARSRFERVEPGEPACDRRGIVAEKVTLRIDHERFLDRLDRQRGPLGPGDWLRRNDPAVFLDGVNRNRERWMAPSCFDRPAFPAGFLEKCRGLVRRRTVALAQHQRATLALLLHESPALSNVTAGAVVELHPNSVRLWRHRWAQGDFSLADQTGRGRKLDSSPSRSGSR